MAEAGVQGETRARAETVASAWAAHKEMREMVHMDHVDSLEGEERIDNQRKQKRKVL